MNRVWLDEQGIIRINVVGDQTPTSVGEMGEAALVLAQQLRAAGRPVYILDDIKQLGETDSAARREVARYVKLIDFDRAVMVGDSKPFMRHSTNLMLKAIGRSNTRYFSSMDAAYAWFGLD